MIHWIIQRKKSLINAHIWIILQMTHKISLLFFGNFLHNDRRQRPLLTRVQELAVHYCRPGGTVWTTRRGPDNFLRFCGLTFQQKKSDKNYWNGNEHRIINQKFIFLYMTFDDIIFNMLYDWFQKCFPGLHRKCNEKRRVLFRVFKEKFVINSS